MSLTNKLAQKISTELNYDSEKSAVISYGIFAFFQIMASLIIVSLIGLCIGVLFQVLVISFAISILRQYSGGIHATRPSVCLIISTVVTIVIATVAHYLLVYIDAIYLISICVLLLILSYYLIAKYAPVDTPQKPIKTQSKRERMKKLSLIVLSVYSICVCILTVVYFVKKDIHCLEYATCLCMASGWQVFTLTMKGHRYLRKVDAFLNKILFKSSEDN